HVNSCHFDVYHGPALRAGGGTRTSCQFNNNIITGGTDSTAAVIDAVSSGSRFSMCQFNDNQFYSRGTKFVDGGSFDSCQFNNNLIRLETGTVSDGGLFDIWATAGIGNQVCNNTVATTGGGSAAFLSGTTGV